MYQLLQAHLSEVPPPLEGIRIGVDPALAALVMACLAKNPDARPATAKAFLHQLDALRSSGAREAIPTVLGSTPRRLDKVLGLWAVGSGAAWILARAAVVGIGLPRWTVTLVLGVAALALPLMVATWYVQRTARRALAQTPALTPGGSVLRGTMATLAIKASPHLLAPDAARRHHRRGRSGARGRRLCRAPAARRGPCCVTPLRRTDSE